MDVKELRIGNLVVYKGWHKDGSDKHWYIRDIYFEGDKIGLTDLRIQTLVDFYSVNHIPLTEEWLLKFGAKEVKARKGVIKEFVLKTVRIELSNSHNFYYNNSSLVISSVHQLQNLVFSLTMWEI